MKLIILLVFTSFAAACGSGINNANSSSDIDPKSIDELRAYVRTLPAPNASLVEVTFHRSVAQGVNVATNTASGKNIIAVEQALFNETEMTASANEAGQPIYTIDAAKAKNANVISATIGGRTFEGRTQFGVGTKNSMMIVVLAPVTKK